MAMFQYVYLNKAQKDLWLPKLFDLLYENMQVLLPNGAPYERQKQAWIAEVSPALDKPPRQVLMCLFGGDVVGYLQYYTRQDLLMIEEIQIKGAFQKTTLFRSICRELFVNLPAGISYLEAYADKDNRYSQKLMRKLGMYDITEADEEFVHFRGHVGPLLKYFSPKQP